MKSEIEVLVQGAAWVSGVDRRSLVARDRRPGLVVARAAVAVAARSLGWPLAAIGNALGGRARSTVHHAVMLANGCPEIGAQAAALAVLAGSVCGPSEVAR